MMENPFDKGARYAAKRDPPRFFQWLIPGLEATLAFQDWVDTRPLPFPGEPDRTCDTVGGFVPVSGGPPSGSGQVVVDRPVMSGSQPRHRRDSGLARRRDSGQARRKDSGLARRSERSERAQARSGDLAPGPERSEGPGRGA